MIADRTSFPDRLRTDACLFSDADVSMDPESSFEIQIAFLHLGMIFDCHFIGKDIEEVVLFLRFENRDIFLEDVIPKGILFAFFDSFSDRISDRSFTLLRVPLASRGHCLLL